MQKKKATLKKKTGLPVEDLIDAAEKNKKTFKAEEPKTETDATADLIVVEFPTVDMASCAPTCEGSTASCTAMVSGGTPPYLVDVNVPSYVGVSLVQFQLRFSRQMKMNVPPTVSARCLPGGKSMTRRNGWTWSPGS